MGPHSSRFDSYHLNGESNRRSRSEDDRGDDCERHLIHRSWLLLGIATSLASHEL
jgi:hypothetical protein